MKKQSNIIINYVYSGIHINWFMGVLITFLLLKESYWLAHHQFFGTLGIPQLEHLFAPMQAPLWPTFLVYIHESWTLGKAYGINLRYYWEHLGELFVNLMITHGTKEFLFKSLPSLSPPNHICNGTHAEKLHICHLWMPYQILSFNMKH